MGHPKKSIDPIDYTRVELSTSTEEMLTNIKHYVRKRKQQDLQMQQSGDEMKDVEGPSNSYVPCPYKKCECGKKPTISLLSILQVHIAKYKISIFFLTLVQNPREPIVTVYNEIYFLLCLFCIYFPSHFGFSYCPFSFFPHSLKVNVFQFFTYPIHLYPSHPSSSFCCVLSIHHFHF